MEIHVNAGLRVAPVASRADIFEGIDTPGGPMDLVAIVANAAAAVTEPDPGLREAAMRASLEAVNAGTAHITAERGEQGVRGARVDNIKERLTEYELQLHAVRPDKEGAAPLQVRAQTPAN